MKKTKHFFRLTMPFMLIFGLVFCFQAAQAVWSEPSCSAPDCNVPAPLNANTVFAGDVSGVFSSLKLKSCTAGQILKYSVAGWECSADNSGNYSAGTNIAISINPSTGEQQISVVGAPTFSGTVVTNGTAALRNTTNNPFYIDSDGDIQLRLDANSNGTNMFKINNGVNGTIFTVDETGVVTANTSFTAPKYCLNSSCISAWPTDGMSGSGTINYIASFASNNSLVNSQIYDGRNQDMNEKGSLVGGIGIGTSNISAATLTLGKVADGYNSTVIETDASTKRIILVGGQYGTDSAAISVHGPTYATRPGSVDIYAKSGGSITMRVGPYNANELVTVSSGGKFSIGKETPTARVDIAALTNTEGLKIISSNYSPLVIRNQTDSLDFLRINEGGYIGIGTNSSSLPNPVTIGKTTNGVDALVGTDSNSKRLILSGGVGSVPAITLAGPSAGGNVDILSDIGKNITLRTAGDNPSDPNAYTTIQPGGILKTRNLDVVGGVKISSGSLSKQTCAAAFRGTLWFTPGEKGESDVLEICVRMTNGLYGWRLITIN